MQFLSLHVSIRTHGILRSVVSSLLLLIFATLISPLSGRRSAYQIAAPSQRPISEFPRIDDPAQSLPNLLLGADLADLIQLRAASWITAFGKVVICPL